MCIVQPEHVSHNAMHTTWPVSSETYEVVLSAVIFNTIISDSSDYYKKLL